ncbi:MAG: hypothetical protein QNK88_03170 [Polaribacter sp.]|jgi:hypothetical protein
MEDKILESIGYLLPSIVTGLVAYFMFSGFKKHSLTEKRMEVRAAQKKEALPIKLQACERLLLFCERINPVKMLVRIPPISANTEDYLQLLIANITQEFEHNFVQQIYVSEATWTAIMASKNAITNKLRQEAENAISANDLRENILIDYAKTPPPTATAVAFIKKEVDDIL